MNLGTLWQDVKYGFRMLAKNPSFSLVAVLTLALGIGANSAIFSVINGILLRPLPYAQSERLMFFTEWSEQVPEMSFSVENFKDLRDQNTSFENMVAFRSVNFILTGEGEPERVSGRQATSGLFPTLRVQPILGRAFTPDEDKPGTERVVLLGEGFWTRRFARDSGVLGKKLTLSGQIYTVIGVLTGNLHGTLRRFEVWTPLLHEETDLGGPQNRGNHPGIYVVGRLKPGVSPQQGRAEVIAIAKRLAEQYPNSNARQSMTAQPLRDAIVGDLRWALLVLIGAVGFVLLIACANVANLQLGRAAGRQKELSVRTALGASRGRLMRQLLTESVLLSVIGGVVGFLMAYGGVGALLATLPRTIPRVEEVRMDVTVLGFTALLAILTGLLFGIVPAWRISRTNLSETLKEGGRGTFGSRHHRLRNALVVSEISLALVLLVGAGLMLRSFFRVLQAAPGYDPNGVLTVSVPVPAAKFPDETRQAAFQQRVLENIKAIPGVTFAGGTTPLLGGWQTSFSIEGKPEPPPGQQPSTDISRISPDYFRAMGLRLIKGRVFNEHDIAGAPRVCIVDETFVQTYWPNEDPLGHKIKLGGGRDPKAPLLEIVGVVNHVKNYGVDQESRVETYLPYAQSPVGTFSLVVRTPGDPGSLTSAVRKAVIAADPDVPIFAVQTLEEIVSQNTAQRRLAALLLGIFAGLALLLAAVGVYGVMSYAVSQRTQEIGIRMALGAERKQILRMVMGQGALMVLCGVGIGLGAAFGLAQLIRSLLFQVSATDPPTFSVVPLVLLGAALVACYVPARRATRVDPMVALRYE
jgi:putative ABC transport system permease protein